MVFSITRESAILFMLLCKEQCRKVVDAIEPPGQAVKLAEPLDGKSAQLIQLKASAAPA